MCDAMKLCSRVFWGTLGARCSHWDGWLLSRKTMDTIGYFMGYYSMEYNGIFWITLGCYGFVDIIFWRSSLGIVTICYNNNKPTWYDIWVCLSSGQQGGSSSNFWDIRFSDKSEGWNPIAKHLWSNTWHDPQAQMVGRDCSQSDSDWGLSSWMGSLKFFHGKAGQNPHFNPFGEQSWMASCFFVFWFCQIHFIVW